MKAPLLALSLFLCITAAAQTPKQDEKAIRDLLAAQVQAWNRGDVSGYMKGYWESDSLLFIGKSGPVYGYNTTLERYKKAYPDQAAMGTLTSTILSMKKLSSQYYFVVGSWFLNRTAGDLSGSWTLLFRRINRRWVIISDHSS